MKKQVSMLLLATVMIAGCGAQTDNTNANNDENQGQPEKTQENRENDNASAEDTPKVPVEELSTKFEKRLYQDTEKNYKVKAFDSKQALIDHLAQIMREELANRYVNDYYKEKEDGLYIIPKDGPALLQPDQPYETEQTGNKATMTQSSENGLRGQYELTIQYRYKDDRWIMHDRNVDK